MAATATREQVKSLAREAVRLKLAAVCVNPLWVPMAASIVQGGTVAVAAVCGFPLGATPGAIKAAEAALAESQGASEIDMVMALGHLKAGDRPAVRDDVAAVRGLLSSATLLKVIIEAPLLTRDEILWATEVACEAGADYIKTGTGTSGDVSVEQVRLIRQAAGRAIRIKAAGGIRRLRQAMELIEAGADRLGTSQAARLLADGSRQED